jgi:hypothetical protein
MLRRSERSSRAWTKVAGKGDDRHSNGGETLTSLFQAAAGKATAEVAAEGVVDEGVQSFPIKRFPTGGLQSRKRREGLGAMTRCDGGLE